MLFFFPLNLKPFLLFGHPRAAPGPGQGGRGGGRGRGRGGAQVRLPRMPPAQLEEHRDLQGAQGVLQLYSAGGGDRALEKAWPSLRPRVPGGTWLPPGRVSKSCRRADIVCGSLYAKGGLWLRLS